MSPESEEPPLSSAVTGAAAAAVAVLVYNCTSSELSSLQVNNREYAGGGIPGMESGSPPGPLSHVSVPLCDPGVTPSCPGFYIGPSGSQVSVAFNGVSRWAQNVTISQSSAGSTVYMWCFTNGFVVSDAQGRLRQLYVQMAATSLASLLTTDPAVASPEEDGDKMEVHWTGDAISVLL